MSNVTNRQIKTSSLETGHFRILIECRVSLGILKIIFPARSGDCRGLQHLVIHKPEAAQGQVLACSNPPIPSTGSNTLQIPKAGHQVREFGSAKVPRVQREFGVQGVSLNPAQLLCTLTQPAPGTSEVSCHDQNSGGIWECSAGLCRLFPKGDSWLCGEKAGPQQPVLSSPFFCLSRKPLEQDIRAALSTEPDTLLPDVRD